MLRFTVYTLILGGMILSLQTSKSSLSRYAELNEATIRAENAEREAREQFQQAELDRGLQAMTLVPETGTEVVGLRQPASVD